MSGEYRPNASYAVGGQRLGGHYFPDSWLCGTYRRNVRWDRVEQVIAECQAAGWRNVEAWAEAF